MEEKLNLILQELKSIRNELTEVKERVGIIELKQTVTQNKLDELSFNVSSTERKIRRDIRELKDGQDTLVDVLEAKEILPKAN